MNDYIRREAAKALIRTVFPRIEDRVDINCVLNSVPAADVVEVRHGRLIEDGYYGQPCVCSVCGEPCKDALMGKPWWNYCPYCGAKLDGGAEDASG